ncbi:amino acid adenylation domain-containing protein, partial [Micromonospora siamensis]
MFDSIVVFENYPADLGLGAEHGLRMTGLAGTEATSFPLNLLAYPGDGLALTLAYDPRMFDETTVRRMVAHLGRIIEGLAAADAAGSLAAVPMLTAEEQREAVGRHNGALVPIGPECLPDLFDAQVRRTPDAPAVRFEGRTLTYAAFAARANQLAHHLRELGVGPGDLVAVSLPRCIELVVALYAVHQAGGAYLPLDPDYPAERLAFMLDDARPRVVLTDSRTEKVLPSGQSTVVLLDTETTGALLSGLPTGPVDRSGLDRNSPAYVIYTSGSTGRPKGVVVPHVGVVNRLLWMQDEYGLAADDRVLQKTPSSFDVSVWEFFWPLMTGAALVVARPDGHADPEYLADLIRRERITTVHFVPSMLRAFVDTPAAAGIETLRRVICSGEALPAQLWRHYREVLDAPLHNLYGPTEASIDVTYHQCVDSDLDGTVPIGRPVWNTSIHILDADLAPVVPGSEGELCIGGVQLALGYLNRPELTAERFVPDPFDGSDGRLYRTGDLARRRADGVIEYRGRLDEQVKVRGFRIELGEIEAVLERHPEVERAAVTAPADSGGGRRLVAHVVAVDGRSPVAAELQEHLGEHLPEHMVPGLVLLRDDLPLTPSGKLDRRALETANLATDAVAVFVAPRTPVERAVAAIWAEVLEAPRIGIEDNFFALGGDSIRTIRIASMIRDVLGVDLPLRRLFDLPTVSALAAEIEQSGRVVGGGIPVVGRGEGLPL